VAARVLDRCTVPGRGSHRPTCRPDKASRVGSPCSDNGAADQPPIAIGDEGRSGGRAIRRRAQAPVAVFAPWVPIGASRPYFAGTLVDQRALLNHSCETCARGHPRVHRWAACSSAGEREGAWATEAHAPTRRSTALREQGMSWRKIAATLQVPVTTVVEGCR
jgi:hypothetical protein